MVLFRTAFSQLKQFVRGVSMSTKVTSSAHTHHSIFLFVIVHSHTYAHLWASSWRVMSCNRLECWRSTVTAKGRMVNRLSLPSTIRPDRPVRSYWNASRGSTKTGKESKKNGKLLENKRTNNWTKWSKRQIVVIHTVVSRTITLHCVCGLSHGKFLIVQGLTIILLVLYHTEAECSHLGQWT